MRTIILSDTIANSRVETSLSDFLFKRINRIVSAELERQAKLKTKKAK